MDELLQEFLVESAENMEAVAPQLLEFESDPSNRDAVADIFRLLHTIKGACGFLDLPRLEKLAHAAETLMGRVRDDGGASPETVGLAVLAVERVRNMLGAIQSQGREPEEADEALIARLEAAAKAPLAAPAPAAQDAPETQDKQAAQEERPAQDAPVPARPLGDPGDILRSEAAGIRVSLASMERIMDLVSELVLTRNQLLEVTRNRPDAEVMGPLQRLSALTSDLQDGVMRARMQPARRVFSKLPRLVRDLGVELDKPIRLIVEGADAELDRQLLEALNDPLTHIVRNCADHGLEGAGERIAAGKPATGSIRVRAWHEAGSIIVCVEDDGRGLDVRKIRRVAAQRGLATEDELAAMNDQEIFRFIFAPGFSTAGHVTNVSGRGVGMDVVLHKITRAGGSVEVASEAGRGARFTLRLPLTLAIAPALVVRCAHVRFALPQQSVVEAISTHASESEDSRLRRAGGALFADLRGSIIPIVDLRAALGLPALTDPLAFRGLIVVISTARATFGLLVDAVADVQEIVVKPIGRTLLTAGAYAGATILGDGSVVLILDPNGLADMCGVESAAEEAKEREPARPASSAALLLFRTDDGPQKAIPLSLVSRIVMAPAEQIVRVEGGLAFPHEGKLIPIAPLCDFSRSRKGEELPILISSLEGETVGLLIRDIVDMVHESLEVDMAHHNASSAGVIGSALVRGAPTEFVDIGVFFERARPRALASQNRRKPRVLLACDGDFHSELLRPVIAAAGFEIMPAVGARQALALVREGHSFEAALADLRMSEMDGAAFARVLRGELRFSAPVLGLAERDAPELPRDEAAAFDEIICKADRRLVTQALVAHVSRAQQRARRAPQGELVA
jgi:two-component system chemotaxis sensor kinase CheA